MEDEYDIDTYIDTYYEGGGYGRRKEYTSDSSSCCDYYERYYDPYDNMSDEEPEKFPFLDDCLPLFCIPDLKEMTAVRIALNLWNHVEITDSASREFRTNKSKWYSLCKDVSRSTTRLSLPKLVIVYINNYVTKIGDNIWKWVLYHSQKILEHDYTFFSDLSLIVWNPNGTINCKETARSMAKQSLLNDNEKYKLLCTYCLKEEIEQVSPLFPDSHYDFLCSYWNFHLRDELDKIPVREGLSLDSFMFRDNRVDVWTAKEYFFNRMNPDDQVLNAIHFIQNYFGYTDCCRYQKLILASLKESQRLVVYMNAAVDIMTNYARQSDNSKDLLSTWSEIRNLVTQDQFVSLLLRLLELKVNSAVLADIWTSASNSFKNHSLNYNDHIVIKTVLQPWYWKNDGDFLYVILSEANSDIKMKITKSTFFYKYCDDLLFRRRTSLGLDKLLELFFRDADERAKFKINLITNSSNVKNRCYRYYRTANIRRLNESLTFLLSSYPDLITDFKRNLLTSDVGIAKCVNCMDSATEVLNKIIKDSIPDENAAAEFKKKIMFSSDAIEKFRCCTLRYHEVSTVNTCMYRYLTSNSDKEALKKLILNNPLALIPEIFYSPDHSWGERLMRWYFSSEDALNEFKSTVPVNDIFIQMLKQSLFRKYDNSNLLTRCTFNKRITLDYVNRFLNWYFEKPDDLKEFKLRTIDSYKNFDMFNMLLKKKDDKYFKCLMIWFFNKDTSEIDKFKTKHKGTRIVQMF